MTRRSVSGEVRQAEDAELGLVLQLIQREFAYMDGLIDPPSSMHRLTTDDLATGPGETWVAGTPPVACVVMTPKPDVLYLGKLAVAAGERGRGLAGALLVQATFRARELGKQWLELETRIELVDNHRVFAALGFVETGRNAHAGYDVPTSITFRRPVPPK